MIKKLINWFKKDAVGHIIIPRSEHGISRDAISSNALKVLYRLNKAGFSAYLVGGCIRDLLLGKHPKDFDIATNADPDQIKRLFSNCRLIGRRFRLAHVHFGRDIIEVATFRAKHSASTVKNDDGMILRDNVYGSIQEDAIRRDFTVNALYYNIANFTVEDFVGGMQDIAKRQITLIGDPELRYREDPVRMLRAIRFAAKLKFEIHPLTAKPIHDFNHLLANIPAARLFEEYAKLFLSGHAFDTFTMLCEYGLFAQLFPRTAKFLPNNKLIELALHNTDQRFADGKSIAPSFLLAVFLWQPVVAQAKAYMTDKMSEFIAYDKAMDKILSEQQKVMSVPRRYSSMIRDVWELQLRLQKKPSANSAARIFSLAKFRAGYDFLLLRVESGEQQIAEVAAWWRDYVETDEEGRSKIAFHKHPNKPRTRPKSKQAT